MSKVQELNNSVYKPQKQNPTAVDTGNLYSSDNRFGLTQRPIDQKKQVRNKWLESFEAGWDNEGTVTWDSTTNKWDLKWKVETTKIYIPVYWYYIVNVLWDMRWSTNSNGMDISIEVNWSVSYQSQQYMDSAIVTDLTIYRQEVLELSRWDYLECQLNVDGTASSIGAYITITKIA